MKLSLCIATMDRWSFLKVSLPKYLENRYIDEIVICDENGNDKRDIEANIKSDKIRVFSNDSKLGAFLNKRKVVSLAKNEMVCLMDSDNFAPVSYFEAWEKFLNGSQPDLSSIYSPSKTFKQDNHPGHNFTALNSQVVDKTNFKYCWKAYHFAQGLFNTGNYILSKTLMAKGESSDLSLAMNCMALDVMFQNYLLFLQGDCKFIVVPDMEYDHALHDGSYYLQTCNSINTRLFNSFYE